MHDPFTLTFLGRSSRTAIYWKPEDSSWAGAASSTLTDPALNTCAPADFWEVSMLAGLATDSSLEITGTLPFILEVMIFPSGATKYGTLPAGQWKSYPSSRHLYGANRRRTFQQVFDVLVQLRHRDVD